MSSLAFSVCYLSPQKGLCSFCWGHLTGFCLSSPDPAEYFLLSARWSISGALWDIREWGDGEKTQRPLTLLLSEEHHHHYHHHQLEGVGYGEVVNN